MHDDINQGARIINEGGLVAFPTETVYGLGADALNPKAVAKIFEAKQRPFFDPLIVHIADEAMLDVLVADVPPVAQRLIKAHWPGPLTLIFKKKPVVPELVTAGFETVAVRMPDHPLALALIKEARCPIAAPSANPFGQLSPTRAAHVKKSLGDKLGLIIDGGPCSRGLESSIVDVTVSPPRLLRAGALTAEIIRELVPELAVPATNKEQITPGSLPYHYAPRTRMVLLETGEAFPMPDGKSGYLTFGPLDVSVKDASHALSLSLKSDLVEAAANLFDCLHRLDEAGLAVIYVKPLPLDGLGLAIMDRLVKAANTFR